MLMMLKTLYGMQMEDLFQKPFAIPWDKTVFGVDNSDIPLYIHMNDVYEIIQGHQMLNIIVIIQLWILWVHFMLYCEIDNCL